MEKEKDLTLTLDDGYGVYTATVKEGQDMTATDLINLFIGIMRTASYSQTVINDALENVLYNK